MEPKKNFSPEQIRQGRQAALGLLFCDICVFGDGLASMLGIRAFYDYIVFLRLAAGAGMFIYLYMIKKPRIVDTPQWYILLEEDTIIRALWLAALIVVGLSLLY